MNTIVVNIILSILILLIIVVLKNPYITIFVSILVVFIITMYAINGTYESNKALMSPGLVIDNNNECLTDSK